MSQLKILRDLIRRPVRRNRIINLVDTYYGPAHDSSLDVISSCDLTTKVYRGKKRKDGESRISHEREMFVILCKYLGKINGSLAVAIFLHDLSEDYSREWPLYRIEDMFGREVRDLVRAVTKPPLRELSLVSAEFSLEVARRVRQGGRDAMILKIIDRVHFFLRPFENANRDKLIWKVAQTMQYIQPMAFEVGVLSAELQLLVAESIRKNGITSEELNKFA